MSAERRRLHATTTTKLPQVGELSRNMIRSHRHRRRHHPPPLLHHPERHFQHYPYHPHPPLIITITFSRLLDIRGLGTDFKGMTPSPRTHAQESYRLFGINTIVPTPTSARSTAPRSTPGTSQTSSQTSSQTYPTSLLRPLNGGVGLGGAQGMRRSELPTGRAVEELQEYGDNYYRWLRQGQGLEQTPAPGSASVGGGGGDSSAGGSETDGSVTVGGDVFGDVSGVDADGDVDDASCPDIGFIFDPDGQVRRSHFPTHSLTHSHLPILIYPNLLPPSFTPSLTPPLPHVLTLSLPHSLIRCCSNVWC